MNQVNKDYADKYVATTYIYAKNGDAYAYSDAAKTVKISAADLKNLFLKGTTIVDGTTEYTPTSCVVATGVATITYVKADGGTPTTAVLTLLKSSEYVAG